METKTKDTEERLKTALSWFTEEERDVLLHSLETPQISRTEANKRLLKALKSYK